MVNDRKKPDHTEKHIGQDKIPEINLPSEFRGR